ncbi:MAG: sigma-54-dependent transcriptional regulator [Thermogutta sp.]
MSDKITQPTPRILIIDDEKAHRELFRELVVSLGFAADEASRSEEALAIISHQPPQLVLLDVRLPGESGLALLPVIREKLPTVPVIIITAYGDVRDAVAAMKIGAVDYLLKPVDLEELEAIILDYLGRDTVSASRPALPLAAMGDVVCVSPVFRRVLETAYLAARSDIPVLILGPSGSGKEVVARLIQTWSHRKDGPFIVANCAGLPESIVESELFGHVKGAFTGAHTERLGYFRAADGGTLFLDEIGELPLPVQAKLLRALETGEIIPVGSERPIRVDFRLLAATNRDLKSLVKSGQFREDLLFRINAIELTIPPLKDRAEDILPLAEFFARRFTQRPVRFSPQAAGCLLAYPWPGNIRQLRNAVQRACLLSQGEIILPEHLPPDITGSINLPSDRGETSTEGRLSAVERATIMATLAECGGNRTQAAKRLGISRRALIYKIRAIESQLIITKNTADSPPEVNP